MTEPRTQAGRLAEPTEAEPSGFRIRFICCGHADGTAVRQTWEEAEALRQSYGAVEGHVRQAIIEAAEPTEAER